MPNAAPQPQPAPAPFPGPAAAPPRQRLQVGRVVGRSFSVWRRNLVPFSIVTLFFHLPVLALAATMPDDPGPAHRLLDQLLSAAAQLLVTGALTSGVIVSLGGGRASVRALLRSGVDGFGTVFVTGLRVGLWVLLGVILLVVPAIAWYCALFVAVPAALSEPGLGSSADALRRSRELTEGNRWAILAVALTMAVVTASGALAAGVAVAVAAVPRAAALLLVSVVVALARTLLACSAAVAYHDLRAAREGVSPSDLAKVFE